MFATLFPLKGENAPPDSPERSQILSVQYLQYQDLEFIDYAGRVTNYRKPPQRNYKRIQDAVDLSGLPDVETGQSQRPVLEAGVVNHGHSLRLAVYAPSWGVWIEEVLSMRAAVVMLIQTRKGEILTRKIAAKTMLQGSPSLPLKAVVPEEVVGAVQASIRQEFEALRDLGTHPESKLAIPHLASDESVLTSKNPCLDTGFFFQESMRAQIEFMMCISGYGKKVALLGFLENMIEWCETLADVHSGGYLHRDPKPEHFFPKTREVKGGMIDFQSARKHRHGVSVTDVEDIAGTATYIDVSLKDENGIGTFRTDTCSIVATLGHIGVLACEDWSIRKFNSFSEIPLTPVSKDGYTAYYFDFKKAVEVLENEGGRFGKDIARIIEAFFEIRDPAQANPKWLRAKLIALVEKMKKQSYRIREMFN